MKPDVLTTTLLALAAGASALMCVPTSLIGEASLPLGHTFVLYARNSAGVEMPVASGAATAAGPLYFPAKLGAAGEKKKKLPSFELDSGYVYADGDEVLATKKSPELRPRAIFLGEDSDEVKESFASVNATCGVTAEKVLRFANVTPLPLASAAINGSFEEVAALYSPVLDNILTVYTPVNLIIRHKEGDEREPRR